MKSISSFKEHKLFLGAQTFLKCVKSKILAEHCDQTSRAEGLIRQDSEVHKKHYLVEKSA